MLYDEYIVKRDSCHCPEETLYIIEWECGTCGI